MLHVPILTTLSPDSLLTLDDCQNGAPHSYRRTTSYDTLAREEGPKTTACEDPIASCLFRLSVFRIGRGIDQRPVLHTSYSLPSARRISLPAMVSTVERPSHSGILKVFYPSTIISYGALRTASRVHVDSGPEPERCMITKVPTAWSSNHPPLGDPGKCSQLIPRRVSKQLTLCVVLATGQEPLSSSLGLQLGQLDYG